MLTNFKKWPMESAPGPCPRPVSIAVGCSEAIIREQGLTEDATTGLLLESTRATVPANQAFTPEELEARIAAHRDRIERQISQMELIAREQQRVRSPDRPPPGKTIDVKNPSLPSGLKYGDLKIVSCAGCKRTLLGESQEPLRAAAVAKGLRTAANFPPPVAKRMFGGRPYCGGCAASYEDE